MQFRGYKKSLRRAGCVFTRAVLPSGSWWSQGPDEVCCNKEVPSHWQCCWLSSSTLFGQSSETRLLLAQGQAGTEGCKSSCWCCFAQFWAPFPWALCPCSAHRGFQQGLGLICVAISSMLLWRSGSRCVLQPLKRWRKGYEAFRVLSPGSGP